jgi:predicted nucleotidyltransferase
VREKLVDDLVVWAKRQPEIMALYLYGSQVEGRANVLSDLDVAVVARPEIPKSQLWRLEDSWAAHWPQYVDLRLLNLAPLSFRYEVTAKGQRLWAANVNTVAEIESLIWRQYWDIRPWLEQDWTEFVKRVMEQRNEVEYQQYETTLAKIRAVHQRVREAAADYTGKLQE